MMAPRAREAGRDTGPSVGSLLGQQPLLTSPSEGLHRHPLLTFVKRILFLTLCMKRLEEVYH